MQQVSEALDRLEDVVRQWVQKPMIKPEITKLGRKYRVQLVEDRSTIYVDSNFDSRCEWTEVTLKTWNGVTRTAWDMWVFDNKRLAEKFVIFYNLRWA